MSSRSKLKKTRHGVRALPGRGAIARGGRRATPGPRGVVKAVAVGKAVSSLRPGRRQSTPRRVASHPAVIGAVIVAGGTVAVLLNRRRIERSMASDDSAWSEIVAPADVAGGDDAPARQPSSEEAARPSADDTMATTDSPAVDAGAEATAVPVEGAEAGSADAGGAAEDEVDEKSPNVAPPAASADEER